MNNNSLIFLDTETTGNDTIKDRLCQVCYRTADQKMHAEYFKPPLPMSVKAMSVTHITNRFLADKPSFKDSEMQKELSALLRDNVMVAHNARFDRAILEAEGIIVQKSICTFRIARYIDPKNIIPEYNLSYLRYYFEIDIEAGVHDAVEDVKVLVLVFEKLMEKMREEFPEASENGLIEKMVEISSHPSIFKIFNFGKYKDRKIEEVARYDRHYLEWYLNKKMEEGGTDEDWIFTLEHYLKS